MKAVDVLEKDFKEAMSCIDFTKEYDPYSKTFMKAVFIGMAWVVAKSLDEDLDIEEELEGAKKYLSLYESTGDSVYKEMASDENRHAGILIKKLSAKTSDAEMKAKIDSFENERQEVSRLIEKPVMK